MSRVASSPVGLHRFRPCLQASQPRHVFKTHVQSPNRVTRFQNIAIACQTTPNPTPTDSSTTAAEKGIVTAEKGIEKAEKGIETAEKEIETAVSYNGLTQAGAVAGAEVVGVLVATSVVNAILGPEAQKS
uniref:Uncharacterized protein n=1 Tax=Vitis vinifera TaxID=29760 RepID=F6I233_VITVI